MQKSDHVIDVLIVGAGMAGLTAARALAERGLRVVVLEALARVGGRVFTLHKSGDAIELGAEFVHGRAAELWALIEEAELETTERDGVMLHARPEGGLSDEGGSTAGMFGALDELMEYEGPDQSFAEYIEAKGVGEEERSSLLGFVEGFNAADAGRIGVCGLAAQQRAEQELEGDRAWHVRGGYDQLAEYLAGKVKELRGEILLGRVVERIDWSRASVRVRCRGGEFFAAKRCVVTLPLGALQQMNESGVMIEPAPTEQLAAARKLAMGGAVRFVMRFCAEWWKDVRAEGARPEKLRDMSFLFTPREVPAVWWTRHPEPGSAMLTAWVGGPRSVALAGLSAEELGERGCRVLAKTFGVSVEYVQGQLISVHTHDWAKDPMFLGAYSYVPVGALEAPGVLARPVEDTLYFAGEHTDVTANWGTVHAAVRSGLRAAAQVLAETSA